MGDEAEQICFRSRLPLVSASLALAVGMLVYLTDRTASSSMLVPDIGAHARLHAFGTLGQWLPSFVHAFAFSLLTAAALHPRAGPAYPVCVIWGALNVLFEIGQYPLVSARLADTLRDCERWLPFARSLSNYFVRGTFDPGDVVAAILGATAAAVVLLLSHHREEMRHAR